MYSFIVFISCDDTFKTKKVLIKNTSGVIYETHVVSNLTYAPNRSDTIVLNITKQRLKDIYKKDANLIAFGIDFYDNVSCIRGYFDNYEKLKGNESVIERYEENLGCFYI